MATYVNDKDDKSYNEPKTIRERKRNQRLFGFVVFAVTVVLFLIGIVMVSSCSHSLWNTFVG